MSITSWKRWCSRHINITAWLAYVTSFTVIACLAWHYPFPPNIAYTIVLFGLGTWVLRRKGRSLHNLWWGVWFVASAMYSYSQGLLAVSDAGLAFYTGAVIGMFSPSLAVWTMLRNRFSELRKEEQSE